MSLSPAPTRRLDRALDSLWYVASAPQTLALLVALLAMTCAFAAILPQVPQGLDAAAAERWLAPQLPSFGQFAQFLRSIGAFNVLEGVWVHLLLAALAFNLMLRLAAQVRFLLRGRRQSAAAAPVPVAPAGLPFVQATVTAPRAEVAERVAAACRDRYPVTRTVEQENHTQVYAEHRRAGVAGPALAYLGALLLIAGLLVDALLGWHEPESIILAPRSSVTVGRGETLNLALAAVADNAAADASVTLAQGEQQATVRTGFARPGRWGNVWLAQRATGPALAVSAHDRSRRPVTMQSLAAEGQVGDTLELLFGQTQNEQAFAIPTSNITLRAIYYPALPDQGITEPVYQVEAYREDEAAPLVSALIGDEADVALDGIVLTLRSDRYVELAVAYLPGLVLLALGGGLLLLGSLLTLCWSPARTWVDLTSHRDSVRVVVRHAPPAFPRPEAARLLAAAAIPASSQSAPAGEPSHDA